jgi:non-specific serine/threonine protein kinase
MGTGKTYCAISLARYWIQQGEAKRILVVCPSSVLFNWKDEVEKFSEYDAHVLHSGKAISREGRIKLFSIPSTFYIINYEATLHYLKYILRLESDIVIFDESSRVANPKAQQTKACAKIASQTKYRYILNGTPIPNRPEGLWSQFYILDFGKTLGPTYKIFKECYFTTIKARSKAGKFFSIIKPKSTWHLAEVAKLVSNTSIRYTKEECAPFLPKKNYQSRELTLPAESRKLYKEVFANAKLEIEKLGQNVSAHIVLTKFIKASQVVSGYLKTDEGNFLRLKSNPKLRELKNLIEEILYEDAIAIWCKYRFSISIIEEMLQEMGVRYEVITGDVKNKSAVAKKFQNTKIAYTV